MKENKQPIFKSIFGSSWSKLPIVIQKHYANRPYSNDVVTVKGKMDIEFNWFGKLCAPLFRIFGTLIPYQGKNIETTVHYKSSKTDNSFSFDRILHFPNKKPFYLRSKMVPIKGKKVIEYMGFGFGLCMNYKYEDDLVKLTYLGYIIKVFDLNIPIPLSFLIGKGYAEERAISNNSFKMFVTITHPLWGRVYKYRGQFNIVKQRK
jgi:hypothetical protein|tara:strand:- start:1280 stop:1894 length:615 start_codon:yes stop_codon:yes gene_type:complete